MATKFENDLLELDLPTGWEFDESEGVLSLYDPLNGKGALQISSYSVQNSSDIDPRIELAEFIAGHFEEPVNESDILFNVSEKEGYSFYEMDTKTDHWIFLIFLQDNVVLFISYNCEQEDKGVENEPIWSILSSLKISLQ